jgi:hypothetical protein
MRVRGRFFGMAVGVGLAALALPDRSAEASAITFDRTQIFGAVGFPLFDSALGTLDAVRLEITETHNFDWGGRNAQKSEVVKTWRLSRDGRDLVFFGLTGIAAQIAFDQSLDVPFTPSKTVACSVFAPICGNQNLDVRLGGSASLTQVTTIVPTLLAPFVATGGATFGVWLPPEPLPACTMTTDGGRPDEVDRCTQTSYLISFRLTYDYTATGDPGPPTAVSAPGGAGLLALGFALLGLVRTRPRAA